MFNYTIYYWFVAYVRAQDFDACAGGSLVLQSQFITELDL